LVLRPISRCDHNGFASTFNLTSFNISKNECNFFLLTAGYGCHEDSVKVFHAHLAFLSSIIKLLDVIHILVSEHSVYGKLN
jgi:hypothetical protein